jgi:hypothetical protein
VGIPFLQAGECQEFFLAEASSEPHNGGMRLAVFHVDFERRLKWKIALTNLSQTV